MIADRLSEWSLELRDRQIPADVLEIAHEAVLDACALAVGGTREGPGRAAVTAFGTYPISAPLGATVLGTPIRLSPGDAALVNGILAHVLQADDGIRRAQGHPGASVVPAALAAAETGCADGLAFLRAVIAGYEVFARLGEALNPPASPSHLRRGFHPSGTVGAVASAAAAAHALSLDRATTADALGLAGSIAGGLMEYAPTGTMATYFVTGNAASVGIRSALLARTGFTGPHSIVEGTKGMAAAMADEVDLAVAVADCDTFRIRETYFKPYPSCRHTHAGIDAALELAAPSGIDPQSIESVEVRAYALAIDECDLPDYSTVAGADSSLQFAVATALRFGRFGFAERSLEAVVDSVTRTLVGRIRVVHDPLFDGRLPKERPIRVTVHMRDGAIRSKEVPLARGEPETRLSHAELCRKAEAAAAPVIGEVGARRLVEAVQGLAEAPSVAGLIAACAPARTAVLA